MKIIGYSYFFLFFILVATNSSCKKGSITPPDDGGDNTDTTGTTTGQFKDIYVAGSLNNGTKNVATYWKNGTAVVLSDNESVAYAIIVDTGYVYVVGTAFISGNTNSYAAYWVNGVEHLLTDGSSAATANSISFASYKTGPGVNDIVKRIYIGGTDHAFPGNKTQAVFWDEDGTEHIVAPAPSQLLDIRASPNYLVPITCGFQGTTATDARSDGFASVWPEKTWPGLGLGSHSTVGSSVRSVASSICPVITYYGDTAFSIKLYACGEDHPSGESTVRAAYWEDGTEYYLTNGAHAERATDIQVVKGTVYVCGSGQYDATGLYMAKYWKGDGTEVRLSDSTKNNFATGIAVKGDDVLVCGYENVYKGAGIPQVSVAKYWENGAAVNLSDGVHNAVAWALYAK